MKKILFVMTIVVSATLAACGHKQAAPASPGNGSGSGMGSDMGSGMGSGSDMGSGAMGSGG